MQIGIQFSQPPVRPRPDAALTTYLSLIGSAHAAGFPALWAGQHFLSPEGYPLFQQFPLLARAAATAPGMTMGTAVMILPLLNPLDVAEQQATRDASPGGRLVLGVGMGKRGVEGAASGVARAGLVSRFEESIEILKRVWSD